VRMQANGVMEDLPPELVSAIFAYSDLLTLPALRAVCTAWHAIVDTHHTKRCRSRHPSASFGFRRKRGPNRHRCKSWRKCVVCYAHRLIRSRRWNLFEWVLDHAGTFGATNDTDLGACRAAAADGDLERLQRFRHMGFRWDRETTKCAARNGHLKVLAWAKYNGCPWGADTCAAAARGGHLESLKWLVINRCPYDESICAKAAKGMCSREPTQTKSKVDRSRGRAQSRGDT